MELRHQNLEEVVDTTSEAHNSEILSQQEFSTVDSAKCKVSVSDTLGSKEEESGDEKPQYQYTKAKSTEKPSGKKYDGLGSKIQVKLTEHILSDGDYSKITVHPLLNTLPKLSEAEFMALETDILERGMLEPIELTTDYKCIDGRARLEIITKNHLKVKAIFKFSPIKDEEVMGFIVRKNMLRRNLNKGQRACYAVKVYDYIKEQREKNKGFTFLGIKIEKGEKSRTKIAKYFLIGETVLGNAFKIYKHSPELLEAILLETITFDEAYKMVSTPRVEHINEIEELDSTESDESRSFACSNHYSDSNVINKFNSETDEHDSQTEDMNKENKNVASQVSTTESEQEDFCFTELEELTIKFVRSLGINEDTARNKIRQKVIKERKALSTISRTSPNTLMESYLDDFYTHLPEETYDEIKRNNLKKLVDEKFKSESNVVEMEIKAKIDLLFTVLNENEKSLFKSSMRSIRETNSKLAEGEMIEDIIKEYVNSIKGLINENTI